MILREASYKILLILFSSLILVSNAHTDEKKKPLKVGVVFAFTGQAAYWSEMHKKGILLANEELKEKGRDIELIFEDSGTSTSGSVSAFMKLISFNRVDAVIGNIWNYLTEPLIPIAEREKILLISPEASSTSCARKSPYFFSAGTDISTLERPYEVLLSEHPEIKSASGLYFDDPGWGQRVREAVGKATSLRGVSIISEESTSDLNPDFRNIYTKLLSKEPDAIFIAHEPGVSTKVLRERRYKGIIVQSNSIFEALINGLATASDFEGVYFGDTDPSNDFRLKFEERFSQPVMLEPHTSYEILRSIDLAYQNNPKDLLAGIRNVKYQGVMGPIDYTNPCKPNQAEFKLFVLKDGKAKKVT